MANEVETFLDHLGRLSYANDENELGLTIDDGGENVIEPKMKRKQKNK